MSCNAKMFTAGPSVVWTVGNSDGEFAFTSPMEANGIKNARFAAEIRNRTTNATFKPIVRFSNDGVTWDAWAVWPGSYAGITTNGITPYDTWVDLTALATHKTFIQFGGKLVNGGSSGVNELALVAMRIETRDS